MHQTSFYGNQKMGNYKCMFCACGFSSPSQKGWDVNLMTEVPLQQQHSYFLRPKAIAGPGMDIQNAKVLERWSVSPPSLHTHINSCLLCRDYSYTSMLLLRLSFTKPHVIPFTKNQKDLGIQTCFVPLLPPWMYIQATYTLSIRKLLQKPVFRLQGSKKDYAMPHEDPK